MRGGGVGSLQIFLPVSIHQMWLILVLKRWVIISKLVSTASIILCTLLSLEITPTSNDMQASFRVKVMNIPQENAATNEENQSKLFQAVWGSSACNFSSYSDCTEIVLEQWGNIAELLHVQYIGIITRVLLKTMKLIWVRHDSYNLIKGIFSLEAWPQDPICSGLRLFMIRTWSQKPSSSASPKRRKTRASQKLLFPHLIISPWL